MKNNKNNVCPFLCQNIFLHQKKNKKNTHSHLADFDSLQSLLSAYLTSLLPSSLTDYPLVSVYCTTVDAEMWHNHYFFYYFCFFTDQSGIWSRNRVSIASTPVLVGVNLMVYLADRCIVFLFFPELKKR